MYAYWHTCISTNTKSPRLPTWASDPRNLLASWPRPEQSSCPRSPCDYTAGGRVANRVRWRGGSASEFVIAAVTLLDRECVRQRPITSMSTGLLYNCQQVFENLTQNFYLIPPNALREARFSSTCGGIRPLAWIIERLGLAGLHWQ
jgi:hypothetical protein